MNDLTNLHQHRYTTVSAKDVEKGPPICITLRRHSALPRITASSLSPSLRPPHAADSRPIHVGQWLETWKWGQATSQAECRSRFAVPCRADRDSRTMVRNQVMPKNIFEDFFVFPFSWGSGEPRARLSLGSHFLVCQFLKIICSLIKF